MQQAGGEEKAVHFWEKDHGVGLEEVGGGGRGRVGMKEGGVEGGGVEGGEAGDGEEWGRGRLGRAGGWKGAHAAAALSKHGSLLPTLWGCFLWP